MRAGKLGGKIALRSKTMPKHPKVSKLITIYMAKRANTGSKGKDSGKDYEARVRAYKSIGGGKNVDEDKYDELMLEAYKIR